MGLKPQDVVVLLKLALTEGHEWTFSSLAESVGMSASEVHNAVTRSRAVGLLGQGLRPNREALLEFLVHGARYVFAVRRLGMTRGMPTAQGAPPLVNELVAGDEPTPVWPDPEGKARGEGLRPLYKSVPLAARNDPALYECLALVDSIRVGRARERSMAATHLRERLERSGRTKR